jgi:hypothetical protein
MMTPYLQQRALLFSPPPRKPSPELGLVLVIPACREPQLLLCLMALQRCTLPSCAVEILVVINHSEAETAEVKALNLSIADDAARWARRHNTPRRWFHLLHHCDMPRREAGVGLARKIGMDEACRRLVIAGNPGGIIASLDADCRVMPNYFQALENHFRQRPQPAACAIDFEYPLRGVTFEPTVYEAITVYELMLRYQVEALRYAGFPAVHHAIGACMAVQAQAYQDQGGMNKKTYGEDVHFLLPFTRKPGFSYLRDTCVQLSPRPSGRRPGGSGQFVQKHTGKLNRLKTTSFQLFEDLRAAEPNKPDAAGSPALRLFREDMGGEAAVAEWRLHPGRASRFSRHANAAGYPEVPLLDAVRACFEALGMGLSPAAGPADFLAIFRRIQRNVPM